eukprot:5778190-Ditylum_brightwellii.AAC.1
MLEVKNFVPKKTISMQVGKCTVYIYPHFSTGRPATEKAYAFMLNKAALEASDTSFKTKIQAFGHLTSTTPLVSVIQEMLINHATEFITKVGQFQVRTYHGLNRRVIPVYLANGTIMPVEGQLIATRRPTGIIYVKIASDI